MTTFALLTHSLFFFCLFVLSCLICMTMIRYFRIMDIPNARSSHETPIPKSGGVVIVFTFLIGVMMIYLLGDETMIRRRYFFGFLVSSLLIAGISFYDDLTEKPFAFKLVGQVFATGLAMASGLVIHTVALPLIGEVQLGMTGYLVTFLWIIGLTNAYNFMDGLNGMAAGPAVIAATFLCVLSFTQGSTFVYIICYTLMAGSLGFMVFNFPKARLFMGDVGAAFLGFVFASLGIIAALYDHSHTSLFVVPMLLFNFIFDTVFTFFRRLLRRENVFAGHRTHLYQLFNQLGHSHARVSGFHFALCVVQGLGAWWMIQVQGSQRVLLFIPFLVFQLLYALVIVRKARKANLL